MPKSAGHKVKSQPKSPSGAALLTLEAPHAASLSAQNEAARNPGDPQTPTDVKSLAAPRSRGPGTASRKYATEPKRDLAAPVAVVPFDTIIEQWQRERPDLDPASIRLFGVLVQAHVTTTPYINRALTRHKLTRGSFDVLSALRRAGPPFSLTPKRLAESLMLSGAGMTSRLDTLEAMNLIARLPEPSDRRSLKIQLTHKGVKLIDDVIPDVLKAQWALVTKFGVSETSLLISLLTRLTEILLEPADE